MRHHVPVVIEQDEDGVFIVSVPVHAGRDLPRGLLRKIVSQDLGMTIDEFVGSL